MSIVSSTRRPVDPSTQSELRLLHEVERARRHTETLREVCGRDDATEDAAVGGADEDEVVREDFADLAKQIVVISNRSGGVVAATRSTCLWDSWAFPMDSQLTDPTMVSSSARTASWE